MDTYISVDIEADGPYPCRYSMLSVGACIAGSFDGHAFEAADPRSRTFYAELKPISEQFDPAALALNGLDRELLHRVGLSPADAMEAFKAWIAGTAPSPVLVAYPSSFDWPFLSYYFYEFAGGPPLSFTRVLDLRTFIVAASTSTFYTPTSDCLPPSVMPEMRHRHNALEDAVDQAMLLAQTFFWKLSQRA